MSHTPGPWETRKKSIKDPWVWYVEAPHVDSVWPVAEVCGRAEGNEANARLIAAAPELLDAAKLSVLMFKRQAHADIEQHGDDEHEAWSALEKAIDKAEGRA